MAMLLVKRARLCGCQCGLTRFGCRCPIILWVKRRQFPRMMFWPVQSVAGKRCSFTSSRMRFRP